MPSRPDFGALGAEEYRGTLATSWGAALVEPGPIRRIRQAAATRLTRLGIVAPPKSGIPPRAVKYFAVDELAEAPLLEQYGIHTKRDRERLALVRDGRGRDHVIERESLKPLVRQPVDFQGRIRYPEAAGQALLFYVHDSEAVLAEKRLRHTLDYIRYGQSQDFRAPATSRRAGGVPAERAQTKVRALWYAVPSMPTGRGRIVWTKGRGAVHYVAELPDDALVLDNFYYSQPPDGLPHPDALAAAANLSFTHVMAEVFGRRAAGDGVLHTYIRELSRLPILDPMTLTGDQADHLVGLFEPLADRPQLPISEELQQADRQKLDLFGMRLLVGDEAAEAAREEIDTALRALALERATKAASGRVAQERARRRLRFDPAPVAARVLEDVGPPPTITEEIESYGDGLGTISVDIPEHDRATSVGVGSTLLDEGMVLVNDQSLIAAPSPEHAEAIVGAIRVDPELAGPLVLPERPTDADKARRSWEAKWNEWLADVGARIEQVLPGSRRATRRAAVLTEVEALGSVVLDYEALP
jgi:hypothetical protein